MIVSPFTPLFFKTRKTDGIESDYVQTFFYTDRILLQIIGAPAEKPSVFVIDQSSGQLLDKIILNQWLVTPDVTLFFTELCLSPGCYSVHIDNYGTSKIFHVSDDNKILENTTLIQYSMKDNRQRNDTIFYIDGMQYFFEFRVPGGFKDSSWTFGVDSEQFITPFGDISQLFGMATTQKKFTLGGSIGVPVHFAEMLNLILTCTFVYFDGIRYSRKDTSVPEMTIQLEGVNSYVFTQMLQQSHNDNPVFDPTTNLILRRATSNYNSAVDPYRITNEFLRQTI